MSIASTFAGLIAAVDQAVFIVTVRDGDERDGCLVGFGTQASIDPPRFLAGLSNKNRTYRAAAGAEHLAIHLVPETAFELARLFGGETGDEVDKFAHCAWHDGPHGLPILDDCASWFVGRIVARIDLGDHAGHLLEPVAAEHRPGPRPLTFQRVRSIEAGHAP